MNNKKFEWGTDDVIWGSPNRGKNWVQEVSKRMGPGKDSKK